MDKNIMRIQAGQVLVFDNISALENFTLGKWMAVASEAVARRGMFTAALSGGSTPEGLYRKLALRADPLLWPRTHIFMVDERLVPHESADSNFRMMDETLFRNAPIPRENIHPVPADGPPELCAQRYESGLAEFFGHQKGGMPVFDLVLLGLGEDGHTASLFPGSDALREKERFTAAVPDEKKHDRVTLTYPVLNSARNVFFLVAGEKKASVLERVVEKRDPALPASAIDPENGTLLFLADSGAAGRLPVNSFIRRTEKEDLDKNSG